MDSVPVPKQREGVRRAITAPETTTISADFFAGGQGFFSHKLGDTPTFSQSFPTIDFNPPAGTVPGTPAGIDDNTRPFTDVVPDAAGNFSQAIIAQGNGVQAGVDAPGCAAPLTTSGTPCMSSFDAAFTAQLTVPEAEHLTFKFFSDDGFFLGIGNGAIPAPLPDDSNTNVPNTTPFRGYPTMGGYNDPLSAQGTTVTVNFPTAGTYPYEVDYSECCGFQLSMTMTTNAGLVLATGGKLGNALCNGGGSASVKSGCAGEPCTSQPVNCATGTFWHSFTDFNIPAGGMPLSFTHTYNSSNAPVNGPLGNGWSSNVDMSLSTNEKGKTVTVHEEGGTDITFASTPQGYVPPSEVTATLVHNGDGSWTFERNNQDTYAFNSAGDLTSQLDLNGYTTTYAYTNGQLTTVTDSSNRSLTVTWNGSHIAMVTDPMNRKVTFLVRRQWQPVELLECRWWRHVLHIRRPSPHADNDRSTSCRDQKYV